MEKFFGLIDSSLGSLIIISLPENEEDSLKEWFRFKKKKVMEKKPDRRTSGHPVFQQKCVSASWVKQWYGILLSILGCGSMFLKLLSWAAQLSKSQNVLQPESNSTHVSENLKIYLLSLKNNIIYKIHVCVEVLFIKCKMNICDISKCCEIRRPTEIGCTF